MPAAAAAGGRDGGGGAPAGAARTTPAETERAAAGTAAAAASARTLASELEEAFLGGALAGWEATGGMLEKYDANDTGKGGGGGEYSLQVGPSPRDIDVVASASRLCRAVAVRSAAARIGLCARKLRRIVDCGGSRADFAVFTFGYRVRLSVPDVILFALVRLSFHLL